MMFKTLDLHFTYHAPTEETTPKYAAIRKAEKACQDIAAHLAATLNRGQAPSEAVFREITDSHKSFAQKLDELAPDGADKAAAYRCIRISRNALNECIAITKAAPEGTPALPAGHVKALIEVSAQQLIQARWQACAAIACGGK